MRHSNGGRAHPQVVVVGGGPAGLTTAHWLSRWGVRTVLVEQRTSPARHPRATLVNVRTMEVFRLLGVADAVRDAGVAVAESGRISWVSTLAGVQIGRLDIVESAAKLMTLAAQSPVFPVICPQNRVETILASALADRPGVRARFGVRAVRISPGGPGVRVEVVDPGRPGDTETLEADYAVLAEGVHGQLREQVGIQPVAAPPLGRLLDIHFVADLSHLTRGRQSALYWVVNPRVRGVIITVDPRRGEWLLEVPALTAADEQHLSGGPGDHAELVRAAIGADTGARIRSVRTWSMGSTTVTRWLDPTGRVFVVGDAAHTFPPTGGFGMNTGIQDAHNLCWKLAGVLHGWAAPGLLASYERERGPVARFNAAQSERNAVQMRRLLDQDAAPYLAVLGDPGPAGDAARAALAPRVAAQRPHFDFQGQALGFRYPVPSPHGPAEPVDVVPDVVTYTPRADPGARAPHAWLEHGDTRVSTCDLTGAGFALLTAAQAGSTWARAAARLRPLGRAATPVEVVPVSAGQHPTGRLSDVTGTVQRVYQLHGATAVLIRPDGHVAARLPGADPDRELRRAVADAVTVGLTVEEVRT